MPRELRNDDRQIGLGIKLAADAPEAGDEEGRDGVGGEAAVTDEATGRKGSGRAGRTERQLCGVVALRWRMHC